MEARQEESLSGCVGSCRSVHPLTPPAGPSKPINRSTVVPCHARFIRPIRSPRHSLDPGYALPPVDPYREVQTLKANRLLEGLGRVSGAAVPGKGWEISSSTLAAVFSVGLSPATPSALPAAAAPRAKAPSKGKALETPPAAPTPALSLQSGQPRQVQAPCVGSCSETRHQPCSPQRLIRPPINAGAKACDPSNSTSRMLLGLPAASG